MQLKFQNVTISLKNVTIGSLERHYRVPEFFFFKLDFEKIEFQKRGICQFCSSFFTPTNKWI